MKLVIQHLKALYCQELRFIFPAFPLLIMCGAVSLDLLLPPDFIIIKDETQKTSTLEESLLFPLPMLISVPKSHVFEKMDENCVSIKALVLRKDKCSNRWKIRLIDGVIR
jgi:hypothetical protein